MKLVMTIIGLFVLLMLTNVVRATPADGFAAVPEPVSLATVGIALASLAGYKLYRKGR